MSARALIVRCSVVSAIEVSIVASNHDWAICEFCDQAAGSAAPMPSGLRHERHWSSLAKRPVDDDSESGRACCPAQLILLK